MTTATAMSVLVTGGGSGIGAAIALQLASRGCQVLISGRRSEALQYVAGQSENIATLPADVTEAADREALVDAFAAMPGRRAVVHAAGYFQTGMLADLSGEAWRRSFETNVEARWELSRACLPILDDGRVLFIGSDAGANPRSGAAAYSIAQSASDTLRRALQAEWADTSTAVGSFKPGLVDTDMVRGFMQLPIDEFPARPAYEDYVSSGQITNAQRIAEFASWLLLDVPMRRFVDTDWDIRDADHHHEWATEPLYPNASTESAR